MKTSKPALRTSAQEECGVWLDTVQLKEKNKQKRLARPISKMLNPFAGAYSLAVALNFTQTKMEMPKTKQSSISAFFTPQRRVLNKMSTSEVPNMDPAQSSSASTLTPAAPVASGTKRRRDAYFEKSDSDPGVDCDWKTENVTENEVKLWQEQSEASHTPSQNICRESEEEQLEELKPPQSKKRFTETSSLTGDSQLPPQAWSQDPLFAYSQYFDSESYLTTQKNTTAKDLNDSEPSFLNNLQSEEAFGVQMDLKGRTSTQNSFQPRCHSSQVGEEKENSRFLYHKSPSKRSAFPHIEPLSNHKWTEPKAASPRRHVTDQLWRKAGKEESCTPQSKRTNLSGSPFKRRAPPQQSGEADEDSLAMLFTQDSEGFRVIAHRGLQVRSPLKDQSNLSAGVVRTSAFRSLMEEDEEDEMLFTQDSQGNMVIKH